MKKLLVILLVLVIVIVPVACAKQETTPPSDAEPDVSAAPDAESSAEPVEKVTVEYWSWVSTIGDAVDEFNASQDSVEVVLTTVSHPDLMQKMTIALSAGTGAPDIFQMTQRHFPNFASTEALYDISADVTDVIGELPESLLSIATYNNKLYGLPVDMSPGLFYYRTDIFDDYGFTPVETFDQIREYGETLRADDKYIIPITTPAGTWACNMIGLLVQSRGGTIYTQDGKIVGNNEDLLVVLEWLNAMIQDDIAANLPHLTPEFWATLKDGDVAAWMFNMPESANIKSNMPELSGKWSVCPLPKWDDLNTHYTGLWGGTVLAIPSQSEKVDAAMDFIRWAAGSVEGQVSLSKYCGFVPILQSAKEDPFYSQGDEFFSGTNLYDQILDTPAFYYYDWAITETVMGEQMDLMFAGEITPLEACDTIIANLAAETGREIIE